MSIAEKWGALEAAAVVGPNAAPAPSKRRHYVPLSQGVDATVREATDTHRIYLGIPEFDYHMRGVGRGHLLNIVGYSHNGKTLLLLKLLLENHDKRIAYFCPDETITLVLSKLAAIDTGVPARELERRLAEGDQTAVQLLREVALERFPNLAVFDKGLTPGVMEEAYAEVQDVWGAPADVVIVDYVDLVEDAGDTPHTKFNFLKAWGKNKNVPLVLIHQTSRAAGAEGRAMTISSGNFGGEQHATFQIGVRRKKNAILAELAEHRSKANPPIDKIQELESQLRLHEYTITLNLVKNKRPGGETVDEIDFELDLGTGRILPMRDGVPKQWSDMYSAAAKTVDNQQEVML